MSFGHSKNGVNLLNECFLLLQLEMISDAIAYLLPYAVIYADQLNACIKRSAQYGRAN